MKSVNIALQNRDMYCEKSAGQSAAAFRTGAKHSLDSNFRVVYEVHVFVAIALDCTKDILFFCPDVLESVT